MKKQNTIIQILLSLAVTFVALFALVYGEKLQANFLQALGFSFMFVLTGALRRSNALISLFGVLVFIFILGVDIKTIEALRVICFSLFFILFIHKNPNRSFFLSLAILWLMYLSMHLLPMGPLSDMLSGISPKPSQKTIYVMLYELFIVAFSGIILSSKFLKQNSQKISSYKYISNICAIPLVTVCVLAFYLAQIDDAYLSEVPSVASSYLLLLALGITIVKFVSYKVCSELENIISHLEICATPESSFLSFSKKNPLPLVEYSTVASMFKRNTSMITRSRRKLAQIKLELGALNRIMDEQNKVKNELSLLLKNSDNLFFTLNENGSFGFISEKMRRLLKLEEDSFSCLELENSLEPFLVQLRYALEWSLDNFDALLEGCECPFDMVPLSGKQFKVYFKSVRGDDLILVYINEVTKEIQNTTRV